MTVNNSLVTTVLALGWATTVTRGCAYGPKKNGYMPDSSMITSITVEGSCSCCAVCHSVPECASFSYRTDGNQECRLYREVAGYLNLIDDDQSHYFTMPGRSGHDSFCHKDSDCTNLLDRCMARICTADRTITCKTLRRRYRQETSGVYWGAVDGQTMRLKCEMSYADGGWTLLFSSAGDGWTAENALWRPAAGDPTTSEPYSIYRLADTIRDSGNPGTEYEIDVFGFYPVTWEPVGCHWSVPRSQTLLAQEPSTTPMTEVRRYGSPVFHIDQYGSPEVVPWLPNARVPGIFVSVNPTPSPSQYGTALARSNDDVKFDYNSATIRVVFYIRE